MKLTLRTINKKLAQYNVEMIHNRKEGYYYFITDVKDYKSWQNNIESLMTYSLEGFTIERILNHVLYYKNEDNL